MFICKKVSIRVPGWAQSRHTSTRWSKLVEKAFAAAADAQIISHKIESSSAIVFIFGENMRFNFVYE